MKGILKKASRIMLLFIAITIWCIYSYSINQESTLASTTVLSGTKIGWGIKRADNNNQPDVRKNK